MHISQEKDSIDELLVNQTMLDTAYIQTTPKFHNKWALVLYVLSISLFYIYTAIHIKEASTTLVVLPTRSFYLFMLNVGVLLTFTLGILCLGSIFIKSVSLLFPILVSYSLYRYTNTLNLGLTLLSLSFWVYFMHKYWLKINQIYFMLHFALKLLRTNVYALVSLLMFSFTLQMLQNYFFLSAYVANRNTLLAGIHLMLVSWTMSSIVYTTKIFVSTVVVHDLIAKINGQRVDRNIFINTGYLLGVCTGLIAHKTLGLLTNGAELCVADVYDFVVSFVSNIYETVIGIESSMALSSMSVHTQAYESALVSSCELVSDKNSLKIAYKSTNAFLSLVGFLYILMLNHVQLADNQVHKFGIIETGIVVFMASAILSLFMLIISSIYTTGIYLYLDKSTVLQEGKNEAYGMLMQIDER